MSLRTEAIHYVEAGWPIFPCRENGKEPACEHGVKDATVDLAQIEAWWPDDDCKLNIGFCPEGAGMCVVDVDPGGVIDTSTSYWAITPRGGHHIFWAGSLPPTQSKIADHVDTRGRHSYVLLAPSVVNGKPYEWQCEAPFDSWELPAIPDWIVEKCKPVVADRRQAMGEIEFDRPEAIRHAKYLLQATATPIEGAGSDGACYVMANKLIDLGLADDTILDLMSQWSGFQEEWLADKIAHAGQYRQNEEGCDAPTSTQEAFGNAVIPGVRGTVSDPLGTQAASKVSRFTPRDIRENLPPPEFFDDEKMLPKTPEGCIGILYGEWGSHKTNTALTKMFDAVAHGYKVLYAAGEGAYGVEAQRVPAHCASRGEAVAWTFNKFKIIPALPMFASGDVVEFVQAIRDSGFSPDIIVLDTLATATAGTDENSSLMASYLTDNGAAGYIKQSFKACVLILAHEGKDAARGVRGHSGVEGNADFVLRIEANKDAGTIKLSARKMRDGSDGHSTFYKVVLGLNGVPVPTRISADEYQRMAGERAVPVESHDRIVRWLLRSGGYVDWPRGCEDKELARLWATHTMHGPRPGELGDAGVAEWDDEFDLRIKALQNAANQKKKWAEGLWEKKRQIGGTEPIRLWFCAPDEVAF